MLIPVCDHRRRIIFGVERKWKNGKGEGSGKYAGMQRDWGVTGLDLCQWQISVIFIGMKEKAATVVNVVQYGNC